MTDCKIYLNNVTKNDESHKADKSEMHKQKRPKHNILVSVRM